MRELPQTVVRGTRARVRITSAAAARAALAVALGVVAACTGSTERSGTPGTAGASGGGGATGTQAGSGGTAGAPAATGTGGAGQMADAAGASDTAGSGGGAPDGAAGSGGADGGSDAGAASLTLPIMRAGGLYVLEMGGLSFTVNPAVGARVTSFKLDGDELLTDATANPNYWGSTLWTSPASDWAQGMFSPPAIVDRDPYTVMVGADNAITATSAPSTTLNGKKFTITKVFRADLVNRTIVIDYKITSTAVAGAAAFNLSHWEVTRVFPNGLTFFPTGAITKVNYLPQPAKVTQALGYTWYDNTTHMAGSETKAGSDGQGGFIAHVAPHASGDLLFIKAFKAVTQAQGPPGENPIQWFCNGPHTYVELEDHSPYDPIAAGATTTRTVTWYLRRLPAGTDHAVGSAALIAAAQSALGKN